MRPSKDPESRDDRASTYIKTKTEPETGAVLMKALDAAREALYRQTKNVSAGTLNDVAAEPPAFSQRQADALALLAETVLDHGIDPGRPGERYQVVVHVDAPVLAETDAPADPDAPGQSPSRTAPTFPQRRPGGWRATRPAS